MKQLQSGELEYRVVLPYACYGIVVENDIITLAPPMIAWAIGKVISEFIKWVEINGGITERVIG